jgi:hypothetical protein
MNSLERIEEKAVDALYWLRTGDGERVASLLRSIQAVCRNQLNLPPLHYCEHCQEYVPAHGTHACRGGELVRGCK